jgi:DnaJ-class molecular chaperone
MSTVPGEIRKCPHCDGDGQCSAEAGRSCAACKAKAGLDPDKIFRDIVCSACGGKGAVWIGPEVVQVLAEK